MADDNDLLKATESIKKDMATKQDIQRAEQGQVQTNISLGQVVTTVKAIEAGQESTKAELKADIHDLGVKLDKYQKKNEHEKMGT